jgi:DNA-binding CsgD family transcriptional regulator
MLSARQMEIVEQLLSGATDRKIAEALGLSPRTISNTLHRLYDRTGVSSRAHLAALCVQGCLCERPNGHIRRRPASDRPGQ